jgi:hypothetical protein
LALTALLFSRYTISGDGLLFSTHIDMGFHGVALPQKVIPGRCYTLCNHHPTEGWTIRVTNSGIKPSDIRLQYDDVGRVRGGIAGLNLRFLPCGGVLFDVLGVGGGFDGHNDVDIVMTLLLVSATVVVVVLRVLTIVRCRRRAKVDKQVVSGGSC